MTYIKPVYYCFECCFGLRTSTAMWSGLVKMQEWLGYEIMNVNSWMVLKSNHCYQRNG